MTRPELAGLHLADDMPVAYRLTRPGYVIDMSVPASSYLPALELQLATPGLRLVPAAGEVPPAAAFCGAWYPDPALPARLQFGWSPRCDADVPWVIAFRVETTSGRLIGEEALAFQLERNGWLVLVDAV